MSFGRAGLSRFDLAYLCFAWIAIVPFIEPFVSIIPVGHDFQGFVLTLLSVPIALGTAAAGVVAVGIGVTQRQELPLIFMSLILVAVFSLFIAVDFYPVFGRRWAFPTYLGASAVFGIFCIRWVLIRQRL